VLRFGDDSPLDLDGAFKAAELANALRFDVMWHSGDAVFIDNHVSMHGRRNFEGRRKVLAAFVA
jgi:alpha-ketoglutarate-dependent taurine dioxygenase